MTKKELDTLADGYRMYLEGTLNQLNDMNQVLKIGIDLGEAMKKDKDVIKKLDTIISKRRKLEQVDTNKLVLDIMKSHDRLLEI